MMRRSVALLLLVFLWVAEDVSIYVVYSVHTITGAYDLLISLFIIIIGTALMALIGEMETERNNKKKTPDTRQNNQRTDQRKDGQSGY